MTVFANAKVVLPGEVIEGHVAVENGVIAAVAEGAAAGDDLGGDYLIPGLVELHTDHFEGHVAPRPKVRWDVMAALQAHDAQIAASGITTVFDCLRIGSSEGGPLSSEDSRDMGEAILTAQRQGRLRAEHKLHLRCEVSDAQVMDGFRLFDDVPEVTLISLMDHTPGQRQFRSIDAYRIYYQDKLGMTDAQFDVYFHDRKARAGLWSDANRIALAAEARERGITVASHDDATAEHVAEAVRDGVALAEFPTTIEAAEASKAEGMSILMGGPNLVRGRSHSGNISASELADIDHLDILSSDYVPFSMLQGAFMLATRDGWNLPRAIGTVTSGPAAALKLDDRGQIAEGRRADLVRVHMAGDGRVPVVRAVYREGVRVL